MEVNYDLTTNIKIKGYRIEAKRLGINCNLARNILLIREGISYKRRTDFDNTTIATIWIQVTMSKNNSFFSYGGI